ncbi:MAG: lysylphosphatidylglycerol synthase transmembrane domain-containing protein [Anaerolineales bacterium]
MTESRTRRSTIRLILGILISAVSLTALILLIDVQQVLDALRTVRLEILLVGGLLVIASLITRAYAWRVILQGRISLSKSFLIINAGYFVNTLLPFRLGEISRAFLLMPSGLPFWEGLPTIVLERMIDVLFALVLLFIGLPYALNFQADTGYIYLMTGAVVLGLAVLALLVYKRKDILRWLENTRLVSSQVRTRLIDFIRQILSSMQVLTHPLRILQVFLGMALSWGIALVVQFLLLRSFIPEARLVWAVFALGAVAIGVSVPSSPGNIGLFEASITLALSAFGVDQSLAFTYALTSHMLNLAISTSFGAYGLVREGVGLREVWQLRNQPDIREEQR